jgi:hypothetical protein
VPTSLSLWPLAARFMAFCSEPTWPFNPQFRMWSKGQVTQHQRLLLV